MNPLSDDARALLDESRASYRLTPADRARLNAAIAVGLPAAAGAAGLAGVQAGALVKVTVFIIAAAVGSVSVVGGTAAIRAVKRPAVVAPPTPTAQPRRLEAPAAEPAEPVEPAPLPSDATPFLAPKPEPEPRRAAPHAAPKAGEAVPDPIASQPVSPKPVPSPAAPRPTAACSQADELALVQLAQRWLLSSAPLEALRQLDRLDDTCPDGRLLEERTALRAIALCLAGNLDEGRAQLALLQSRNAGSPALARVREACSMP